MLTSKKSKWVREFPDMASAKSAKATRPYTETTKLTLSVLDLGASIHAYTWLAKNGHNTYSFVRVSWISKSQIKLFLG